MLFGKKKQEPAKEEPKKEEEREIPYYILTMFGELGTFAPTQPRTPEQAIKLASELNKLTPATVENVKLPDEYKYYPVGIIYRLKKGDKDVD